MNLETLSVTLHDGDYHARIFAGEKQFCAHVRDHFCNPSEPWARIFGLNVMKRVCQKLPQGSVSEMNALYAHVVQAMRAGVMFAAKLPLYAVVSEQLIAARAPGRQRTTVYFIAREGFVMVSANNIVRTAYFVNSTAQDAAHTLFKAAWKHIKCKCAKRQYVDAKYQATHLHINVRYEAADTWRTCPNPHAKPATQASRQSIRAVSDDDAKWCRWIERYEK